MVPCLEVYLAHCWYVYLLCSGYYHLNCPVRSGRLQVSVVLTMHTGANVTQDCADTSVIRTPSRRELLYPRSKIAIAAKAFGLEAIDMVRSTFHYSFHG
jgi:hypothetical protein